MIYTGSYYPSSVRMRDLSDQLEPRREFQSIQPRPGLIPSAAPVRSHPSSYSFGPPNDPGPYRGFSSPSAQDHLSGYSQPSPVYPDHAKNYQAAQLPPLDASQVPNWQYPYPAHYSQQDTCSLSESRPGAYERVAGKPSYPPIAPSRGPKQRFTQEDDDLLKKLKEDYISPRLSWKQIADFFPDRNSGTLQVRYCTKLKKKDEIRWTEESVSALDGEATATLTHAFRIGS